MKLARLSDGNPEIFFTLQGEGNSLGKPAVFIRLSTCNLHCVWCDTPYTWNWERTPWDHQDQKKFTQAEEQLELPAEEIAPLINRHHCSTLVITGGEPLLQQHALIELIPLLNPGVHIEIETNGTRLPLPELDNLIHQYNVSPKLSNSGMPEKKRLTLDSLRFFSGTEKAQFKFVVQNEADLTEVLALQHELRLPPERISLMPEGRHPDILRTRSRWLAEQCLKYGLRFSPRLHVDLWGDQRAK